MKVSKKAPSFETRELQPPHLARHSGARGIGLEVILKALGVYLVEVLGFWVLNSSGSDRAFL